MFQQNCRCDRRKKLDGAIAIRSVFYIRAPLNIQQTVRDTQNKILNIKLRHRKKKKRFSRGIVADTTNSTAEIIDILLLKIDRFAG